MSSTHRQDNPKPSSPNRSFKNNGYWIAFSFAISAAIIGWAALKAVQSDDGELSHVQAESVDPTTEARMIAQKQRSEAQAYREQAIADDREFLASIKRRPSLATSNSPDHRLPDRNDAKIAFEKRAQVVQTKIDALADAEEGSLAAQYRQELIERLEDAPL